MSLLALDREQWPVLVLVGVLLFAVYAWIAYAVRPAARTVLLYAAVFRLVVLWLPPTLSDDAYRYVWDGIVQTEGINPYAAPPAALSLGPRADALKPSLNSEAYYSVYPPASQAVFFLAGLAFQLGGWPAAYGLLKLVFAGLELLAVALLLRLAAPRHVLLYAWNPLVVLVAAGQLHTEAIMVAALVGCVLAVRRKKDVAAGALLAVAGLVKLVPFVLVPWLWRYAGRRAAAACVVVGVVGWLPYAAPYVPEHIRASLTLYSQFFEFNAGLYYGLKAVLQAVTGADWSKTLGPVLQGVFLLALPALFFGARRAVASFDDAVRVVFGLFLVCATTVHPWYLLGVLVVLPLRPARALPWLWLSMAALGTYLRYVEAWQDGYWMAVAVGWAGWAVFGIWGYRKPVLQTIGRTRARSKVRWLLRFWPASQPDKTPRAVLDLGAGEGYVGEAIGQATGDRVALADVVDFHEVDLPFTQYDGRHLPFADDQFDVTVLYFVLHHCEDAEQVVREAARVTRGHVLVVESVYEGRWDHALLRLLDRLANRIRSGGAMRDQEEHLAFRKADEWQGLFERHGGHVVATSRRGRVVHRQVLFVVALDEPV